MLGLYLPTFAGESFLQIVHIFSIATHIHVFSNYFKI